MIRYLVQDFQELDIDILHGKEKHFRCRIWDFRIIFSKKNGKIEIEGAGHRWDVYKNI